MEEKFWFPLQFALHLHDFHVSNVPFQGSYEATGDEVMKLPVAHLVVHWAVTREVVSSKLRPDQHSGSLNTRGEKCCLCNFICKWLDFQVFSDKDDKQEVPSHNSLNVDNSVGR